MARLARAICTCMGLACAVWLWPASIHIVDWTGDGAVRVALLPPVSRLWLLLAAAVAAAIALEAGFRRRRGSARRADGLAPMAPLALLWLWAIPYLPWLPDRAPGLLVFAGPMRWAVVALAVFGCVWKQWSRRGWPSIPIPGRRTVAAITFVVYVGFGLWSANAVGPGADEPHYLVITQSLLRDHDLAIENNHARGDYREYFGGPLRPDFLRRGLNEVIYSIHAPGLPALLVPAFAIAGYRGAVVMLCLFGAMAALAVFELAMRLAGRAAAGATWAAVCLTVPFVPHAWLIFPEMPGALLVAWAALWLYAPLPLRLRTWLWRGAALALLPWLHTKFVVLLAAMAGALAVRIWRSPKAVAALLAPVAVSVALWVYSFYLLYGVFDPQIPYGDFPKLYVLFANIPRGVLGLLFDQKFGLLPYAPIYAIAIAGSWIMVRRPALRWFALALLATVVGFVASSTRMYMWWGGSSAPARFLVPILPLLAPMIAVAWQEAHAASARTIVALLLAVSVAIALAGAIAPQRFMLFSAPHGFSNLASAAEGPSPLIYLLPSFTEDVVGAPLLLLAPFLAAAAIAAIIATVLSRRAAEGSGFTAAAAGVTTFVVAGVLLAGSPALPEQRRVAAMRGRLDLMRAYDGPASSGFDYATRRSIAAEQVLAMGALHLSRAAGELSTDPARFAGPFELPAGRFTARMEFGSAAIDGTPPSVAVLLGGDVVVARAPAAGTASIVFDVPVDAPIWLAAPGVAAAALPRAVEIAAESIVPRAARPHVDVQAIEAIPGRQDAFIVYADRETYPEGGVFWTRDTRPGQVLVAAGGASTIVVTLHVGPSAGRVRLIIDGQDRSTTLAADQTVRLEFPLSSGSRLVPIVVEAPGSFRPSDHDPGSSDHRWLGCQVRIELR